MPENVQGAFDVLVVGSGTAGITAAVTAVEAGKSVALVDDNPVVGGQIWRGAARQACGRNTRRWFTRLSAAPIIHVPATRIVAVLREVLGLTDLPKRYSRRWHAESFMSGLKRTMGSTLAARSEHALFTEAALRVLAYALRR